MATLTQLRCTLGDLGIDTATPGLRGEDRLAELKRRVREAVDRQGASAPAEAVRLVRELHQDESRPSTPQGVLRAANDAADDISALTMTELRARLTQLGLSTATGDARGDERKRQLQERLRAASRGSPEPEKKEDKEEREAKAQPPPPTAGFWGPRREPEPETETEEAKNPLQTLRMDQLRLRDLQDQIQSLRQRRASAIKERVGDRDSGLDVLHHELSSILEEIERIDSLPDERTSVLSRFLTGEMETFDREDLLDELTAIADDVRARISEVHKQIREEEGRNLGHGDHALEGLVHEVATLEDRVERASLEQLEHAPPMLLPSPKSPKAARPHPRPGSGRRRSPSPSPSSPPPMRPKSAPKRRGPRPQPVLPDRSGDAGNAGVQACRLREEGDLAGAHEAFLAALRLDPQHVINTCNFALFLHHDTQELDRAQEMYLRAIELDGDNGVTLSYYAGFLAKARLDLPEAAAMHQRAVAAAPADANVLGNYANFLKKRGDLERAVELLERALEAQPHHDNNLSVYAGALKKLGRLKEAERAYERAIELNPSNALCLGNYANFKKKYTGDLPSAKELYQRALRLAPDNRMLSRNYAVFLRDHPEMRDASGLRGTVKKRGHRAPRAGRRPSTRHRRALSSSAASLAALREESPSSEH